MNIKKIIQEEVNDFEWIKDLPDSIVLEGQKSYVINCCDTPYDEDIVRNKLRELVGHEYQINWFNNENIVNQGHRVLLSFELSKLNAIWGGWGLCHNVDLYSNYEELTLEEFLITRMK